MTNEEASIIIGNIPINSDTMDDCYSITEYQEAKTMAIKALEQEQKTGHWIRVDDTKMKCSNCDIIHLIAQYPRIGINYCPSCGARMEGGAE